MDPLKSAQTVLSDAMSANNLRMQIGTENYVNARSTASSPEEDPYNRKQITFKATYDKTLGAHRVEVDSIGLDPTEFGEEYNPSHPAADENGMVKMPNVKAELELVDVQQATVSQRATLQMYKSITETIQRTHGVLDAIRG